MAKKRIPKFSSEGEEQKFWSEHESTEYFGLVRRPARGASESKAVDKNHLAPAPRAHDRGAEGAGE